MELSSRRTSSSSLLGILFCLLFLIRLSFADDASYDGDSPKYPGCDHPYNLVNCKSEYLFLDFVQLL